MQSKKIILGGLLLGMLLFVYKMGWIASYVGWFEDDARYILLAKALLAGKGYVNLEQPGEPAHMRWPPGFPLLLTPFVALWENDYNQLKWVNTVLTSINVLMCHYLFREKLPALFIGSLLVLLATNKFIFLYSSTVMSDPFFMFLSLTFMIFLSLYETRKNIWKALLIGIILMASISVRVAGFILFLPLFLMGLKYKDFLLIIGGTFPTIFLVITPLFYNWSQWSSAFPVTNPFAFDFKVFIANAGYYLQTIISSLYGDLTKQISIHALQWVAWLVLIPLAIGAIMHCKKWKDGWVWYAFLYFVSITFWWSQDPRLLLPLLPFLYYFSFQGFLCLFKLKNKLVCVIITAFLIFAGINNMLNYFSEIAYTPHIMNTPNHTVFAWLKKYSDPEDVIYTAAPGRTYLFTDRKALAFAELPHRFQMLGYIFNKNIHYLYFSADTWGTDAPAIKDYWRMVQEDPLHFTLIFQDMKTASYIYEVKPRKEQFLQAISLIDKALLLRQNQHHADAIVELKKVLSIEPDFYLPLNLLGLTLVEAGKHQEGIAILKHSISLYPSLENCYVDLAMGYKKSGDLSNAAKTLRFALTLANQQHHNLLVKQIQQELQLLQQQH